MTKEELRALYVKSNNNGFLDFEKFAKLVNNSFEVNYPTANEVCKALQKDCKIEKVIYDNGRFYDEDDGETLVSQFKMDGTVLLDLHDFIFRIDTLGKIFRFYEGLEELK